MKLDELKAAYDVEREDSTCPRCYGQHCGKGVCGACAQAIVPLMLSALTEVKTAFDEIEDAVSEFPCDGVDHERLVYEGLARARDQIRDALARLEKKR